jgi:hypothetical protein
MSYQYTNFENKIPVVEKYINKVFHSTIDAGNYQENDTKYNYYVLDPDDDNSQVSYILRIEEPLKNHQVFACGAGGSGGLMYGRGGNGGNYLYIDNLNANPSITSKQLAVGSYLIIPAKAQDTINDLETTSAEFNGIINQITLIGSFYLIRYDNRHFNQYKGSLSTIDRYKTRNWNRPPAIDNTTGEIINIEGINSIKNTKMDTFERATRTIELIFYLKKTKSFRFTEFNNPHYTRIIRISNNNNINTLFIPSPDNNYLYTAGDFDEVINILCYPNGSSVAEANKINWTTLFDINYAITPTNKYNYYVYDFNKRVELNTINSIIEAVSISNLGKNTNIYYNKNHDATYALLESKVSQYYLGIQGGANGFIQQITTNRFATISNFLKRYYMPYLFTVDNIPNFQGGAAGSTFTSTSGNIIINKLGGANNNFIKLIKNNPRNVSFISNTNEWISGYKGTFGNNFKIYAYYRKDQNLELNNNTLCNGGFTGYWQFIKDEINYNYGANGVNDLNSPNYGAYGSGGQGGSILIDKNSKMTGSKGKDGVFILSFINYAVANIVNNNPSILKKMYNLFISMSYIDTNNNNYKKLTYINDLRNNNKTLDFSQSSSESSSSSSLISNVINNTFIHEGNIHLNETYITKLNSYINKDNLVKIIAVSYIIQRIYYVISESSPKILETLDITKINNLQIIFIDDITKEGIQVNNNNLNVNVYDNFAEENIDTNINIKKILGYKYIKAFFSSFSETNYHQLFSLNIAISDIFLSSKKKIVIMKENNQLFDMTNDIKTEITDEYDNNYYKFLIMNISYLFDIPHKDFKVNINVINTIYQIFRLNTITYSIMYNNYYETDYKSKAIINKIYSNFKEFNFSLKEITNKIEINDTVFLLQNDFKLYFNSKIIDYDKLKEKNIQKANIIKSKKAFMDGKESLKKTINMISIIMTVIIIVILLWILILVFGGISDISIISQLTLILGILVLSIFIINYYEKYYSYKENFENDESLMIKQFDIFSPSNDFSTMDITYNDEKYKITFINSNSEFILYKTANTSMILIQPGETAIDTPMNKIDGTGGTINIYNDDFISNNIEENKKYKITFTTNSIDIEGGKIKTAMRTGIDNKDNIKVIYNNDSTTINNNSYPTLKSYYDNLHVSQIDIMGLLDILFTYSRSTYVYGSKGNTFIGTDTYITKFNNPSSYGIGGIYNSNDKNGSSGVVILITKEIENEGELHMDLQTLINFYNNNINKLIYGNFNDIYLLDNSVIYKNANNAFKKRLDTETEKEKNFTLYEDEINDYSHIILMNVYYKFALVKLFVSILIGIVFILIIYYLNKDLWKLLIILLIFIILYLVISFIYNSNINTRKDYYKYYWSKYNYNTY